MHFLAPHQQCQSTEGHLCSEEMWVYPKIWVFPCETKRFFLQIQHYENLAIAHQPSQPVEC